MQTLQSFYDTKTEDLDQVIQELLNHDLLENQSPDKKEIMIRAKDSVKVLQRYIQEIKNLDKTSLSPNDLFAVGLTNTIVRNELKLLNTKIGLKDWAFLARFRPYQVLT